jgi:hypothetical protein
VCDRVDDLKNLYTYKKRDKNHILLDDNNIPFHNDLEEPLLLKYMDILTWNKAPVRGLSSNDRNNF